MKRIVLSCLLMLASFIAVAQGISPEMGKRLTRWAKSKDAREILVYQVLREMYPNESYGTLSRKLDSFGYNVQEAEEVFLGIYRQLGPDYAYASLYDGFTKLQMAAIDKYYTDNGGTIKRPRTEAERKKLSGAAGKEGITVDMAWRLSDFVTRYPNMQHIVSYVLSEKGIDNMGIYRIIDNFDQNLDYVEEIILAIYDRYGSADRAYQDLRLFLTIPQIDLMDSIYAERERKKNEARKKAIELFEKEVYSGEPYAIPEYSLESYSKNAFSIVDRFVKPAKSKNFSLIVRDSLYAFSDPYSSVHKLSMELPADLEYLRDSIANEIKEISIDLITITSHELNVNRQVACSGFYEFTYSVHQEEYSFEVSNKKLKESEREELESQLKQEYWKANRLGPYNHYAMSQVDIRVPHATATLITGNEETFDGVKEEIAEYLYDEKKFGKRKVKVIKTIRNNLVDDIKVFLLDKKAVIE